MNTIPRLAIAAIAGLLLAPQVSAQNAGSKLVLCYDKSRDAVASLPPGKCEGRMITKEEADAVRKRRINRIRGVLKGSAGSEKPGNRLKATGSGFFVTDDGLVLTNDHVVEGCSAVSILTPKGTRKTAEIIDSNARTDLALLRAPMTPPAIVQFRDPVNRAPGNRITLVGYPMNAAFARIQPFFTPGQTLMPRSLKPGYLGLKFKADVRPDNSGGPLLDDAGLVIGVVTAKVNTVAVAKRTGKVILREGFATDNAVVFTFLKRLGVAYHTRSKGPILDEAAVIEKARRFATRVECWH